MRNLKMKPQTLILAILLVFAMQEVCFAKNLFVKPQGAGTGTTDWNNATGCLKNLTIARGDVIYLADGDYKDCETTVFQFAVANSGTTPIEFRKATIADHASATGWSDSMGVGQAILHPIRINCVDYVIINGVSRTSPTSGHGIKIHNTDGAGGAKWSLMALQIGNHNSGCGSSHVTLKYIEVEGSGYNVSGVCDAKATDQGINWSWTSGPAVFSTNHLLQYSYVHDVGGKLLSLDGNQDVITIEHSYIARNHSGPTCHSEGMALVATTNLTYRYNVMEDVEGTAYITTLGSGGVFGNWAFYGNVFWRPTVPTRSASGGGVVAISRSSTFTGFVNIYNNTFVNANYGNCRLYLTSDPIINSMAVQNNLWVNCITDNTGAKPAGAKTWAWSHNAYFDSGSQDATPTAQITTGNPLTDWPNKLFTITKATSAGVTLDAPFNTDPLGVSRGADGLWDRGAFEFDGFVRLSPPTNLRIIP